MKKTMGQASPIPWKGNEMGDLFAISGWLMAAVGAIWMLIEAFKTHVLWGLASLFIPPAQLVWIIMHFDKAWKPLLTLITGMSIFFLCIA